MALVPEDFNSLFSTLLGGRFEGRDLQDGDVITFDGEDNVWRNAQPTPWSPVAGITGATTGAAAVSGLTLGAGEATIDLTAGNAMLGGLETKYGVLLADVRELRRVVEEILEALVEAGVIEDIKA